MSCLEHPECITEGKTEKIITSSHYLNKFALETPVPILICVNQFGDEGYTCLYIGLPHT